MKLTDRFVEEVEYEGETYCLRLQFDAVLTVLELMEDKHLTYKQRLSTALYLLLEESTDSLSLESQLELFNRVFDILFPQKETSAQVFDITGEPMPIYEDGGDEEPSYSFTHDAERIYASFVQAYGIDLFEVQGVLRWEKFLALLHNLPADTSFMQVVNIRKQKLPESGEARADLLELKARYALPKGR